MDQINLPLKHTLAFEKIVCQWKEIRTLLAHPCNRKRKTLVWNDAWQFLMRMSGVFKNGHANLCFFFYYLGFYDLTLRNEYTFFLGIRVF